MPHYKCVPCRTRLETSAVPDEAGVLCPGCGAMLEPVEHLSDIVGFAAITRLTATGHEGDGSLKHNALADRLSEAVDRRRATPAEDDDDEPGLYAQAVAVASPRGSARLLAPGRRRCRWRLSGRVEEDELAFDVTVGIEL